MGEMLKTLKDIEKHDCSEKFGPYPDYEGWCNSITLKQEAIKDIKSFGSIALNFPKICGYTKKERNAIINYIKWKFNITEEDLK